MVPLLNFPFKSAALCGINPPCCMNNNLCLRRLSFGIRRRCFFNNLYPHYPNLFQENMNSYFFELGWKPTKTNAQSYFPQIIPSDWRIWMMLSLFSIQIPQSYLQYSITYMGLCLVCAKTFARKLVKVQKNMLLSLWQYRDFNRASYTYRLINENTSPYYTLFVQLNDFFLILQMQIALM